MACLKNGVLLFQMRGIIQYNVESRDSFVSCYQSSGFLKYRLFTKSKVVGFQFQWR